jgi:hypothetical protein
MSDLKIQRIVCLETPVTITYRREGGEWMARALEFDLIGIGATRTAAFQELRKIVDYYLAEFVESRKKTRFLNPSEDAEWSRRDKEQYRVVVALRAAGRRPSLPATVTAADLRKHRSRILGIDMIPAKLCAMTA